ncbi:MAG: hypothetical protein CL897_00090 [Dehalococcoidia bacterium]|nr:hypothetical protein [Dehalococcoidia bacterium]|tara:strand:- start:662 stop:1090 length:429 start_codon:yes stop_codon:yes gene_type:complete
MATAEEGARIWLGENEELGFPDLTGAGWERFTTADYALLFRKEGASAFAIRVREADAVDDVPARWERVHAVPLEQVKTVERHLEGYEAVEHEAPCEKSELLRTLVVRTDLYLVDIGQLAMIESDHRGEFEAFLAEVRLGSES